MGSMFVIVAIALSILVLIVLTIFVKLHPFFALSISAFFFGIISGHSVTSILEAYSSGLGGTISGIGIVIAMEQLWELYLKRAEQQKLWQRLY